MKTYVAYCDGIAIDYIEVRKTQTKIDARKQLQHKYSTPEIILLVAVTDSAVIHTTAKHLSIELADADRISAEIGE